MSSRESLSLAMAGLWFRSKRQQMTVLTARPPLEWMLTPCEEKDMLVAMQPWGRERRLL